MKRPEYPFSAVVGQERAKLSLLLVGIDPLLGGVLLSGTKGTAKSTLARGLATLLPPTDRGDSPFYTLPLNASEDRVLGGLEFQVSIEQGKSIWQSGLLEQAHGGVLYVDEINLMDDHLADVLLDTASEGILRVERDGFSRTLSASWSLIGTMNPEEGRLRPQLLDRFGLCVRLMGEQEAGFRKLIIKRRLAFEACPEAFVKQWEAAENELRRRLKKARSELGQVEIPEYLLQEIVHICRHNRTLGQRAEISMTRAARACAAWRRRRIVSRQEIAEVAPLVLSHRYGPPAPETKGKAPAKGPASRSAPAAHAHSPKPSSFSKGNKDSVAQQSLEDRIFEVGTPFRPRTLTGKRTRTLISGSGRRTRGVTANRSGRVVRTADTPPFTDLSFPATFAAAAVHQLIRSKKRTGKNSLLIIEKDDLRRNIREGRRTNLLVFCVDASGSMAAIRRMEAVKGAVFALLIDAYQKRDQVALVTFRGREGQVLLPPTPSVERAHRYLKKLSSGGRTPLSAGLVKAFDLAKAAARKDSRLSPIVVVLSDGRGNVALGGGSAMAEELTAVARLCRRGFNGRSYVVDSEPQGRFRLNRAVKLADELNAEYVQLEALRAKDMVSWLQQEVLRQ